MVKQGLAYGRSQQVGLLSQRQKSKETGQQPIKSLIITPARQLDDFEAGLLRSTCRLATQDAARNLGICRQRVRFGTGVRENRMSARNKEASLHRKWAVEPILPEDPGSILTPVWPTCARGTFALECIKDRCSLQVDCRKSTG